MSYKLAQKQSLSLEQKEILAGLRIKEWVEHYDGDVEIAFSGGWDSTVLIHLIRSMYPDVAAVFVNTGLEFPEIVEHVKTFDGVEIIKPRIPFTQVIEKYGYPVVSKKIAMGVSRYRNTNSEVQRQLRLHGGTNPTSGRAQQRTISKKWHFLIYAPFKISERCCDAMKKDPLKRRYKEKGLAFFTGEMAGDSEDRRKMYNRTGCNAFNLAIPKSMPLATWTKQDVLDYSKKHNLKQCSVYEMGYDRTGCIFCAFGCHMEPQPGRFVLLRETHPKLWAYCMDKLGMREVLNYVGVPTGDDPCGIDTFPLSCNDLK